MLVILMVLFLGELTFSLWPRVHVPDAPPCVFIVDTYVIRGFRISIQYMIRMRVSLHSYTPKLYFYTRCTLLSDSIRTMVTHQKELTQGQKSLDAKLDNQAKEYRGQRNFYITGFALFLIL